MTRYLIGDNPSGEEKVKGLAILEPLEPGYVTPISRQGGGTTLPPEKELEFRAWYRKWAERLGLNPDPDDPRHFYDYRAAFLSNAEPDETGHWPSQFKLEGHPRMNMEGVNTKTGQRVPDYKPSEMLRDQMDILKTIMNETKGKINQPPKTPEVLPSRKEGGETSPSTVQPIDWGKEMLGLYKSIVGAFKSQTQPQPPLKFGEKYNTPLTSTEKAAQLIKGPSLPQPTKTPTSGSYEMTADIAKPPTDLYAKLKEQFGPYGHGPVKSLQGGGPTNPDDEDELEELKRLMTTTPQTSPITSAGEELAARARWETPVRVGEKEIPYPEAALQKAKSTLGPSVFGVSPGYEGSYYGAHPEERYRDMLMAERKPMVDLFTKLVEEERDRAAGFRRGMEDLRTGWERRFGREREPEWGARLPVLMEELRRAQTGEFPGERRAGGLLGVTAPARQSKDIFDPGTGITYRQDLEWSPTTGTWEKVGGTRAVSGPAPKTPPTTAEIELVKGKLRRELRREPTEDEVMEGVQKYQSSLFVGKERARTEAVTPEVRKIGDAIMEGKQAPIVGGLSMARYQGPLRAYLADQGYDMLKAEMDFHATKRYVQQLNSSQQVRMRQATKFAYDSLDIVEDLAKQWDAGNYPILNRANLLLAKQGAFGQHAASVATKLDTQISDLVSELGTVYKGGYASTDETLKLAAKNLSADWSREVLENNIDLVRQNLKIRLNSLSTIGGPAGLSTGPPVIPKEETPPPPPSPKETGGKAKTWEEYQQRRR